MKSINTSKVSGTQELLPAEQAIFDNLKNKVSTIYHQNGFFNIETPSIERAEILFTKAGQETEKQIYKLVKTSESDNDASEALRFDHTVPLARYIIEYENDLTFPFKVSQIGTNFRGERPQKGRFREFYQLDVDIIGRDKLPIAYDADVISTLLEALSSFNLNTPILARINNRKILSGLLEFLSLAEKSSDIYSIIDHSEKVDPEKTKANLSEIGLDDDNVKKILAFINLHGKRSFVIKELNNLGIENELYTAGVNELDEVLYLLESLELEEQIEADMKIVRGLDYYTGTVFEFILPEHKQIGSICGGGRYENLTKFFSEKSFPGVGGSIGLSRLFYVLKENNLLQDQADTLLDYAVIPVSEHEQDEALNVAKELRKSNHSVSTILTDKKLSDKMSYATKIAKNGIVIGEEEVKTGAYKVKDFQTGKTTELSF